MQSFFTTMMPLLGLAAGIYLILFRADFIARNVRLLRTLHQKTGIGLFAKQAEEFDTIYMKTITFIVGVILVLAGCYQMFYLP